MGFNSGFKGLTLALDLGGRELTPRPGRFIHGNDEVRIV